MSSNDTLVIVSGARTPMAEYSGTPGYGLLKKLSAIDLGAIASKAAMERGGIAPEKIDHVFFGNALQTSNDALYGARHVGLKAGVPETVPALTVNRICGSGLQSVVSGAQEIQLGRATTTLCGGMESMSQAPFVIANAREGRRLSQTIEAKDLLFEALMDPYCGFFMAQTAENVAKDYEIPRAAQDEFAYRSHKLGTEAVQNGVFDEEIVPVTVKAGRKEIEVTRDDHVKPDTSLAALAKLRPAFGKEGTVTAGNASGIVDGAAAVVVTTKANADKQGWKVLAEIVEWDTAGVPPRIMGMGPAPAIRGVAKRAGIDYKRDIDLYEINEAFAAQYLGCEKELDLDRDRVNVYGGAIAIGHPLGATGTRIIYSLALSLARRDVKYGVASACIGGGQGIAVLLKNPAK